MTALSRSSQRSRVVAAGVIAGALASAALLACGSGPSKSQALETIQAGIKEDGNCTLPIEILTKLKVQHVTKGMCVPKEGADKAKACLDALVAAGVTHPMPEAYMLAWPDDVSSASLSVIPAYERRPRNLVYTACVELTGGLRTGLFTCADARAEKVTKVESKDPTHADVGYEREVTLRPTLTAIDAACGTVSRPPTATTAQLVKSGGTWALASSAAGDGGTN